MAATYQVINYNAGSDGSATKTVVTNVRFRSDDDNTSDLTNPVLIDSVARYSYWKSVCLRVNGTFTQVDNFRHYTDGTIGWTLGTSGQLDRGNRDTGDHGVPEASYEIAEGTAGTTGDTISSTHTYYSGQSVKIADMSNDTSASPATIDSTAITVATTDTKHIVMQITTDTDGTQGTQSTETLTWKVDEI